MDPKIRFIVIIVAVALGVLVAKNKRHETASQKWEREHNVTDPGEDPRFKAAEAEARRHWPEFVTAFNRRWAGDHFAVKAAFKGGENTEWMWVAVTGLNGNVITGTVDNEPVYVHNVKEGQSVNINVAETDDWVYKSGSAPMVGGFTSKVLKQIEGERK